MGLLSLSGAERPGGRKYATYRLLFGRMGVYIFIVARAAHSVTT